jgi:hypothetical protein
VSENRGISCLATVGYRVAVSGPLTLQPNGKDARSKNEFAPNGLVVRTERFLEIRKHPLCYGMASLYRPDSFGLSIWPTTNCASFAVWAKTFPERW